MTVYSSVKKVLTGTYSLIQIKILGMFDQNRAKMGYDSVYLNIQGDTTNMTRSSMEKGKRISKSVFWW